MIERLVIHRFRGICEGMLEGFSKVNILIGPNNSGKSAILEMLYLGGLTTRECQLITENTVFEVTSLKAKDFIGYVPVARLLGRHMMQQKRISPTGYLTAEGGLGFTLSHLPEEHTLRDFRLALPQVYQEDSGRVFTKEDLQNTVAFTFSRQKGIPADLIPHYFVEKGVKSEENRWHVLWQPEWVYSWGEGKGIDHLAMWAEAGNVISPAHVLFFDFHTTNGHFTADFVNNTYREIPDWYEKIAQSLSMVFPQLQGAIIEVLDAPERKDKKTGYIRFKGKKPLTVDHFGDGTRHAFKVLTALVALAESVDEAHPGLFLWEDPELFMHPASLSRLFKEVMRLIAAKSVQIMLCTQSLEVLAWFINAMEESTLPSHEVSTFYLNIENGVLKTRPFRGKALAHWLEFSGDPRMLDEDEMSSPLASLLYRHHSEVTDD